MKVKILGIAGSVRHGNTDILVKECLSAAGELKDVETEFVSLPDYKIDGGCMACLKCYKTQNPLEKLCQYYKDDLNKILRKMLTADGFILGSPVYHYTVTWKFKCFIERWHPLSAANHILRNKAAGAVTVALARNFGQEHVLDYIVRAVLARDMIPVGTGVIWPEEGCSSPIGVAGVQGWPRQVTGKPDELTAVKQDVIALAGARILGKRVAEMAKVVKAGFTVVNPENKETFWPYGPASNEDLERAGDYHYKIRFEKNRRR